MNSSYFPLKSSERITLIDALRGFAIFGILMVNIPLMYQPITQLLLGANPDVSLHQIISESFIKVFFEGKFYVIFSMLFGFGFWIFIHKKLAENDSSVMPVYRRRLFFLLLFGVAHVVFLWAGDILVFYALFGFALILFKDAKDKTLFKWVIAMLAIPIVLTALMTGLFALFSLVPEAKSAMDAEMQKSVDDLRQFVEQASLAYSQGSFSDMIAVRLEEYTALLPAVVFFYPVVLGMFLVGMWAGRSNIITNYMAHLPLFRKTFGWGLSIGLCTGILYAVSYRYANMTIPGGWSLVSSLTHIISGVALGLCYVSGIVLLYAKGKASSLSSLLSSVGRMALTNYLMQSIICTSLFYSYGLGWFGKVEVWQGIVMTFALFAIQIVISQWWLQRFLFGPFEWLWRSLTYLKVQPFRRK